MSNRIPTVIHQTWRDTEIPERWRVFQASWRRFHPDWDYHLWTDLELRQFIRDEYSWFLPIYDNYPEQIQRVDVARYFLLHRYGGLYVDLDFECLRPIESLIENKGVVLGFEPQEHFRKSVVKADGLDQVACNAFMASQAGHGFWEHVFLAMIGAHRVPGPLPSTGPLMLTRALQTFHDSRGITCVESKLLYPGTSDEAKRGLLLDATWRAKHARESFAIHHWSGSWIPKPANKSKSGPHASFSASSIALTIMNRGRVAVEGSFSFEAQPIGTSASASASGSKPIPPEKVSCLMVTRSERLHFIKRAIGCFQAQTYRAKELVIVDDGANNDLAHYLESISDSRIIHVRLPHEGATLGRLRNIAVERASGTYVMQWDDDDLYHSRRIETQMAAIRASGATACLLSRWKIWWPAQRRIATSKRRGWEGSILCARDKMPRYDETKRRGEDTPAVLLLASREKVAFIDAPWLYTYIVHGTNTTPETRLEEHWAHATQFHWGKSYESALRAVIAMLPQKVRKDLEAEFASAVRSEFRGEIECRTDPSSLRSPIRQTTWSKVHLSTTASDDPKILILSPVKDGLKFIDGYFDGLKALAYPHDRISICLLEGDSTDGSYEALVEKANAIRHKFSRVEVFKRDHHFRSSGHRAADVMQLQRRSILARSRNYLLARSLRDEDWVLWLDFDVVDYPASVISDLLAKGRDIVVPHCVIAPGGRTFDLNTFIRTDESQDLSVTVDGRIAQPARGVGRKYLEEIRDRELVEVDAVGGTMLLVKADLHREGLIFPVAPYKGYLETEGLSFLARDMGVRSWGAPQIEVIHANH